MSPALLGLGEALFIFEQQKLKDLRFLDNQGFTALVFK